MATTDKRVMRERLAGSVMTEPKVFTLSNNKQIPPSLNFPLILKPSISSASRGVTLINSQEEFEEALERALPYCNDLSEILLEEFIDGQQYSIETVSFDGQHHIVGIVQEVLSGAPYFMERMDIVDKDKTQELMAIVEPFMIYLLNILNVQYGPCHTEVKIKGDQIALIEIASRSGLVRDRLLKVAKGVDYNELILRAYLGETDIDQNLIHLPQTNAMLGIMAYEEDRDAHQRAKANGLVRDEHLNEKDASKNATMLTDAIGYYFLESSDINDFDKYHVRL
nr:ATP-grasp domain-containing protein [Roseivirga sp. E12]